MGNVENSFAEILQDYSAEAWIQTLGSVFRVCVEHNIAGTSFVPVLCYSCVGLLFRQYIILSNDGL